mgnify:CR=1 FL=1
MVRRADDVAAAAVGDVGDAREETNDYLVSAVPAGVPPGPGYGTNSNNQYSIIGSKPDLVWRCRGDRAASTRRSRSEA